MLAFKLMCCLFDGKWLLLKGKSAVKSLIEMSHYDNHYYGATSKDVNSSK